MTSLRHTALGLALGLAFATNAMAVTTIPFWHSMEGELGKEVDSLAQRFNDTHPDYKIVPVYKGNYEQSLSAGIAAFRTGNAPALLQVYEVGTATMMASKAIKPVYEVFKDAGINFDESQFVPTVAGYYTDSKTGHLLSQPFNSSTPVLYYNKDAFKKAGLDPEQPPKTWQDLAEYTAKLKAAGMKCGYASGWQGWIQIENFSAWHGLPVATKNNGFDGTDAVLEFNKPEQVKHIALLEALNKKGDFSYFGRKDESTEKFYNGDCAITTASSGSLADIRHYAKFNYGVGMGARYGHTMIEFDAKLSKDGEIFLLHDDNLERTSNGWGVAGELPWRDLLNVDAGSWYSGEFKGEPLPLLANVADRCRQHGMMANIEIKPTTGTGPLTGKVVALAARELWEGMTAPLLSSFEIDALEAAQAAVPELPRGLLLDEWREDWRELTSRLACVSIHLNHSLLDEARVKMLKAAGLHILVYTVNKPQRAAELLRWGVDCICTDAIDLIGPNFSSVD